MAIFTRLATQEDAGDMCQLLNEIIALGGTTAHRQPFSEAQMIEQHIAHPLSVCCTLAIDDDSKNIIGFQALEWSDPDWVGDDPLPADWAVISTFVAQGSQGKGVGNHLFAPTLKAAKAKGVTAINATIRRENTGGQRYYDKMGFVDFSSDELTVSKKYDLA